METGTKVFHRTDPLLGIGEVVDQIDGHPEMVIAEWPDTRKTCHIDELKAVVNS